MRLGLGKVVTLVVSLWSAWLGAALAPDRFLPAFETGMKEAATAGDDAYPRAAEFEYVFFGGIVGEYLKPLGHFADMRAELFRLGVPRAQTHLYFPRSTRTVEENARGFVRESLVSLASRTPRKLVIVAHSKACLEVLAFALAHPEFVEKRVEALFLVQGPFGGSPLADYLMREALPEWRAGRGTRLGMFLFGKIAGALHPWIRGVESLTTSASNRRNEGWRALGADVAEKLADKILYVQSFVDAKRATARVRVGAHFIESLGRVGDGAVALDAQKGCIGKHCVVLPDVDHSLPCSRLLTWRSPRRAWAFAQAVLASVGRDLATSGARAAGASP